MGCCSRQLENFEFSPQDIEEAVRNSRLLTMEIEFSRNCNFRCPYCYVPQESSLKDELTPDEIRDAVLQAKDLGARTIIILGGEPTIYPHFLEMVRFMRSNGLQVDVFTNGSKITPDLGKQLFEQQVRVVLKMNTFDEKIQDVLSGKKGSYRVIQEAYHNLLEAGYPSEEALLAVGTIICRQNIDEIVPLWRWLRGQGIAPYFEMITPQANAKKNEWLDVDPRKLQEVFAEVAEIDRLEYGQIWDPQPPLLGNRCMRHKFSCVVSSNGDVLPCVGIEVPIGNIREGKLREIIQDSEILQDLKDHRHTIKGPCRSCEKAAICYGCRGAAYQLTGDYLASDPLCWKNAERQEEIARLPLPAVDLIPQQTPMRVIDTLVSTGDRCGEAAVTISDEMPFVGEDGALDKAAYFEMMAQSIAAVNGFKQLGTEAPASGGLLVGARKLELLERAQVGDTLKIRVRKHTRFGKLGIVTATVSRNKTVLARGEIKIQHDAM